MVCMKVGCSSSILHQKRYCKYDDTCFPVYCQYIWFVMILLVFDAWNIKFLRSPNLKKQGTVVVIRYVTICIIVLKMNTGCFTLEPLHIIPVIGSWTTVKVQGSLLENKIFVCKTSCSWRIVTCKNIVYIDRGWGWKTWLPWKVGKYIPLIWVVSCERFFEAEFKLSILKQWNLAFWEDLWSCSSTWKRRAAFKEIFGAASIIFCLDMVDCEVLDPGMNPSDIYLILCTLERYVVNLSQDVLTHW